ncbi:hypothetical protein CH281_20370 [Rhodococcus sp. 06-221-2]|nr:hypothetical protein CH281_20370 [Rhodococcus sp. 06-221-2]
MQNPGAAETPGFQDTNGDSMKREYPAAALMAQVTAKPEPGLFESLEDFTLTQTTPGRREWVEATHHTIALHLSKLLSGRVKYEVTGERSGQWFVWTGERWSRSGDAAAQVHAAFQRLVAGSAVVAERVVPTQRIVPYRTVKLTPETAMAKVESGELTTDGQGNYHSAKTGKPVTTEMVEDKKWAGATSNLDGTIRQLKSMWNTRVLDGDVWDEDGYLLNTPTGTVDLRTGEVRDHRSLDLITKVTNAMYDEDAEAPRFRQFMDEILPDAEVRGYVQRALGAALCGDYNEHHMICFVGVGRNGKSVLLEILADVLGSYAGHLPGQVLVERQGEAHPTELMVLDGARLVTSSETRSGQRWNTELLKKMTGGDTLRARGMHQDFRDIRPTYTLVVATNHRPDVGPGEQAFWKRYREVPFTRKFEGAQADPRLKHTIVSDESNGVLSWLLEGWKDYESNGLQEPESVTEASRNAAANASTFAVFARECFEPADGHDVTAGDVFTAWRNYRAVESDNPRERPTRSKDIGPALVGELADINITAKHLPRQGGNRPAKFVGIRFTDRALELLKTPDPYSFA